MGPGADMTTDSLIDAETAPLADQVVLNALPYAAVICDRSGKVLQCNDAMAKLINVARDRMIGRKAGFLSPGLLNDIDDVFASGRTWRGDIVLVNASNDSHVCDLSIAPLEYFRDNETRTAVLMTLASFLFPSARRRAGRAFRKLSRLRTRRSRGRNPPSGTREQCS